MKVSYEPTGYRLPSVQNNPHVKVPYFGVMYSAPLQYLLYTSAICSPGVYSNEKNLQSLYSHGTYRGMNE